MDFNEFSNGGALGFDPQTTFALPVRADPQIGDDAAHCTVPKGVEQNLYGGIVLDHRNENLTVVNTHISNERIFESWAMALLKIETESEAETYLFPTSGGRLDIEEIQIFCDSVRKKIISKSVNVSPELLITKSFRQLH